MKMIFSTSTLKYWKIYDFIFIFICISCIKSILSSSHSTSFTVEVEESEPLTKKNMSAHKSNLKLANSQPKIGIIGGGIGGTATAYFLRKLYKHNISLHLYEPEKIGGRLLTSSSFDRKYEAGGAIIHPENQYMNNFIKELGLQKNFGCQSKAAIFNGQEYAFIESDWSFINAVKAFLRYGLDLYWLQTYNSKMLKIFAKIYDHQREGLSFKSVEALLHSLDSNFPSLVRMSFRSYLKENKFHDLIIDELVAACTRANYGQSPNIHAFVGSVSVAAASPDLWSVVGGNKKVPEELLSKSEAHLLQERVTRIAQTPDGKFKAWSTRETKGGEQEEVREFDAIAIAAPLTKDRSHIDFVNFSTPFHFPGRFERIVCTLIEGKLNETTFKYKEVGVRADEILTDNPSLDYNSVGRQNPIDGDDRCNPSGSLHVFKVFSQEVLTEAQLSTLFESHNRIEVIDWLAYPHYESVESLGRFELVPGLYYNNAIEKAASAMEMSAIAAHNTAFLIRDFLNVSGHTRSADAKEEL